MIENIFIELAIVLAFATILALIFEKLKQPVLLAYIITGIVLGTSFLNILAYNELLAIFSELGIAFLLFLVGINLDPKILQDVGKTSIITGIGQIAFTSFVGFVIASFLGFNYIESIYIGIALTFSSTIIIVKLLSDKGEINSLYGKISLGFLLVQDFIAIIALIFITSLSVSVDTTSQLLNFAIGILLFVGIIIIASTFLTRKVFNILSKNQEILFLGSIAWCFIFISISIMVGISKEIGAFLAGILIAQLPYSKEISNKLKYLRDFFIVLFFVVLGSNLVFLSIDNILTYSIIFSIFILIGNPIIVFVLMVILGYKGRTSFLSSLTVAQISEFSLILVFLGAKVGHLSELVVPIITLTGLITISISTYLIKYNNQIYNFLSEKLPVLKNKRFFEDSLHIAKAKQYDIVCIGYGETGQQLFNNFTLEEKDKILIVDFDPAMIKIAADKKFNTIYGDTADIETIDILKESKPKIIVSTIGDIDTNILICKKMKKSSKICVANDFDAAKKLYKSGANYVIIPGITMSEKIETLIYDLQKGKAFELYWLEKKLKREI